MMGSQRKRRHFRAFTDVHRYAKADCRNTGQDRIEDRKTFEGKAVASQTAAFPPGV